MMAPKHATLAPSKCARSTRSVAPEAKAVKVKPTSTYTNKKRNNLGDIRTWRWQDLAKIWRNTEV